MKERPMLFNGEMVRAVLDGRKTQTRRVCKKAHSKHDGPADAVHLDGAGTGWIAWWGKGPHSAEFTVRAYPGADGFPCPYGVPGDRLWPAMEIPSLGRNYCADTFGTIWSRARDGVTWRRLKGSPTSKGYLCVTPAVDGTYKTRLVHRLVAEAFYEYEPRGLKQVRHLDGSKLNNAPENLDWGTQQDNWSDRLVHGRGVGENHHSAKLTSAQADEIRKSDSSQKYLSAQYKVSQATVWGIKNGCCWCENPKSRPPNMPRWASRITLEVVSVRVERVKDIHPADCLAEGTEFTSSAYGSWFSGDWESFCEHEEEAVRHDFSVLWDSINAKRGYSWDTNPWVWVVEFKVIK